MVIFINVIYLIPSIRNGLRPYLKTIQSNITVLQDMIEVRDGGKACESLAMYDVYFIIDDICIN